MNIKLERKGGSTLYYLREKGVRIKPLGNNVNLYLKNNPQDIEVAQAWQRYNFNKQRKEREKLTLLCCDAARLPLGDETVDVIITSPPYNLGSEHWPMGGNGRTPRESGIGYADDQDEHTYQQNQVDVLNELYRVAKNGASLFYNHKVRQRDGGIIHPLDWLRRDENRWRIRQEIIWDRTSTHNHCPTLFWQEDERIYWMTKGNPVIYAKVGYSTVWTFFGPKPNADHPAPFAEELPRRCLQAIGGTNLTVLDPYGGSMTTVKVALGMGHKAIGVDIDERYIQRAKDRYVDGR